MFPVPKEGVSHFEMQCDLVDKTLRVMPAGGRVGKVLDSHRTDLGLSPGTTIPPGDDFSHTHPPHLSLTITYTLWQRHTHTHTHTLGVKSTCSCLCHLCLYH